MIAIAARRFGTSLAAVLLLGGISTACVGAAQAGESSPQWGWREISWPFLRDAWEPGRAFICTSEECAGQTVYIRPKIGFCNCTTGISDDDEVDRVIDLDLIDPQFRALGSGRQIEAAGMRGRARHYSVRLRDGSLRTVLAIALSRRCDVVVAVAQSRSSAPINEQIALGLLSAASVQTWVDAGLEGRP
jgi:hypothetical protein